MNCLICYKESNLKVLIYPRGASPIEFNLCFNHEREFFLMGQDSFLNKYYRCLYRNPASKAEEILKKCQNIIQKAS